MRHRHTRGRLGIAQRKGRHQLRDRRLPRELLAVDQPRHHQRRERFRHRADHEQGRRRDRLVRASLADAEAFLEHDLAVLHDRQRNARHIRLFASFFGECDELLEAGGIERVRAAAGEILFGSRGDVEAADGDIELCPAPFGSRDSAVNQRDVVRLPLPSSRAGDDPPLLGTRLVGDLGDLIPS